MTVVTDKTADEIHRGEQARAVLDSDAYKAAWDGIMSGLQELRGQCPVTDTEQARALIVCERMALKLKAALEDFMATGRLASEQLRLDIERQAWLDRLKPPWMRRG